MRLRVAAMLTGALIATGCSKSSVQMLKDGDPKVCAKSDVTDQLFEIIRQNASPPPNRGQIADYDGVVKGWLAKVRLTIDNVTSTDVDVPNRKITCSGQVHISADGVEGEQTQNLNYQVATDLSTDKAVVSAQLGSSAGIVSSYVSKIAAPEIEKAERDRGELLEKQWVEQHAADIALGKSRLRMEYSGFTAGEQTEILRSLILSDATEAASNNYDHALLLDRSVAHADELKAKNICQTGSVHMPNAWEHCDKPEPQQSADDWTAEENEMISQADALNEKCRGVSDDNTQSICDQRDALMNKMEAQGICWGPDDAIGADKHWMRCP